MSDGPKLETVSHLSVFENANQIRSPKQTYFRLNASWFLTAAIIIVIGLLCFYCCHNMHHTSKSSVTSKNEAQVMDVIEDVVELNGTIQPATPNPRQKALTEAIMDTLCIPPAFPSNTTANGQCLYMIAVESYKRTLVINYKHNVDCTYEILTRHGCKIEYKFHRLETEYRHDYLDVNDGFLTGRHTGTVGTLTGTTKEEFLKIFFHTDARGDLRGDIRVTFKAVKAF